MGFEYGSVASISYFSNGSNHLNKEYLEVFCGGWVAVIDDFKSMYLFGEKVEKSKLRKQDKGHREEVRRVLTAIEDGLPSPVSFDEIYLTMLATFKILESIWNFGRISFIIALENQLA